jgi:hypothetical protein
MAQIDKLESPKPVDLDFLLANLPTFKGNEGDVWIKEDLASLAVKEMKSDKQLVPFMQWVANNIKWLHHNIFKWFKVSTLSILLFSPAIRELDMRKRRYKRKQMAEYIERDPGEGGEQDS